MPACATMASDMAETWRNCFEEELICPICLHVFSEPIQLPCKHNFCRACISEAWAKDSSLARCPECNHAYTQKPNLEKNHKLSNIVEKYNALSVEKAQSPPPQCILCRRGPPLPAVKVCLRCNAPCCQSHVQTHLQQPCSALGHLLVEAEAVKAWTCPQHDEYRLYHCEAEQTAVCQYCCFARCHPSHGHAVADVELRRNDIRQSLLRQQERVEERVQEIEEQLCKLDSDKCVVEDRVCELKEDVRLQYQRMHQLLEEDLVRTLEALERAQARFCQENAAQVLALGEQRHEAQKLLSSINTAFGKAEELSFMKNTKPVKILTDRSQVCVGSTLPPYKVGNLNAKLFLSEITKREKSLKRTLEAALRLLVYAVCAADLSLPPCKEQILTPQSLPIACSPHPSLHLPAVRPGLPERPELRLCRRETETFHRFPGGRRERGEERHSGLQRCPLLLLVLFLIASEQATLPGLRLLVCWRRSVHQSAGSGAVRPASHQRRQRRECGKREQLIKQPPFRRRLQLFALPPRGWRGLLTLFPAGRAAPVRRSQDPGVHHG
ncbi:E3 ubiquitin-protein ligase TRIM8b isoform X2 [Dunckerocampus dactyliophorus]|uniref:E3 ubiquitin-protein ligase TRIM8b isoform X2 n=1 Tax=Dunckerocampus dactyliophorus TaxID=161453 RepID=UPI002404E639|nr:E3 ubiquitin-protein ligase TRIM8b isoform X2 [Dunckerocampus dactyliophorus]